MAGLLFFCVVVLTGTTLLTCLRNKQAIARACMQLRAMENYHEVVILMPVCARPWYLQKVLAALAEAASIENTLVVFSQDGADPEVLRMVRQWRAGPSLVVKHTPPFCGLLSYFWDSDNAAGSNIRFLLNLAFQHTRATGAVVLEDDIVPSRDFILYYQWVFRHVLTSQSIMSVTGFNLNSRLSPSQNFDPLEHVYELLEDKDQGRPRFTGWSWALTRAMWERVQHRWTFRNWDINLSRTMREMGLSAMKPVLARARNIGMRGINFTESENNPKWHGVVINPHIPEYDQKPAVVPASQEVVVPFHDISEEGIDNQREKNRPRRWALYLVGLIWILLEWRFFYS